MAIRQILSVNLGVCRLTVVLLDHDTDAIINLVCQDINKSISAESNSNLLSGF